LASPHRPCTSFNMPATGALRAHATDLQPRPRSGSDHALELFGVHAKLLVSGTSQLNDGINTSEDMLAGHAREVQQRHGALLPYRHINQVVAFARRKRFCRLELRGRS
jgi:hypothetical protein